MVGDARKDAANPLASFREDGSGDEADAPSWRIGPYSVMDLLDMASAAAAVVPRITDVLEPEARGRTGIDARTSAAMRARSGSSGASAATPAASTASVSMKEA